MLYHDLRSWIKEAQGFGELRTVKGADWNLGIGAITEVASRLEERPAVLFDKIRDYLPGRRLCFL